MTTIKLRRGLSTAFSTNNPVLQAGEPAFATDTGILKIGDGTTAYNSLPSIGASPDLSNYVQKTDYASTSAAGVIKVDGSTINIDANGVISSSGSAPSNMVTTNTAQTITGYKTFNEGITIAKDGLVDPSISMSDGTTSATVLSMQYNQGTASAITLTGAPNINVTATGKLAFSGNPTNVVRSRAGVEYEMLDVSMVDGTTITYDAATGKISAAGGGGASIDDNNTSSTTTFSSQKIVNTITQASTDVLDEVADEFVASTDIRNMVKLTQAAYDALATKDANTFYIIVAASS